MKSRFAVLAVTFTLACSAGFLAGCGDDDDNPAQPDGSVPDGSVPDGSNPDGGCKFNDFVINLINTQTNNTAKPSTDLGDGCTDDHSAFPATLFQ